MMSKIKNDIACLEHKLALLERKVERLDSYYIHDGVCGSNDFDLRRVIFSLVAATGIKWNRGTDDTLSVPEVEDGE